MARLFRKLFMRSKRQYTNIDQTKERKTESTRITRPAHFLFRIESFTQLSHENYESPEFECGDHTWKLSLYPNGNTKLGGKGHVSLYLVIADAENYSLESDVHAMFKLFVFDQKQDSYLTIQDDQVRRFSTMKKEWGFTKLISLKKFYDATRGYLVDDSCVFGVEVLAIPPAVKLGSLSVVRGPRDEIFTLKIEKFSTLDDAHFSEPFTVQGHQWKLVMCRSKESKLKGERRCFLLTPHGRVGSKLFVRGAMRVKSVGGSSFSGFPRDCWFGDSVASSMEMAAVTLSDLTDESGSIPDDSVTVEVEILTITKLATSESK
uniref:MATH domain-containing protein n=1 Tax=Kalanchoe fedtschenkoi TaxID=63787 RepID=A0A7N0UQG5_KALFE